jgi:hypothetical protein
MFIKCTISLVHIAGIIGYNRDILSEIFLRRMTNEITFAVRSNRGILYIILYFGLRIKTRCTEKRPDAFINNGFRATKYILNDLNHVINETNSGMEKPSPTAKNEAAMIFS